MSKLRLFAWLFFLFSNFIFAMDPENSEDRSSELEVHFTREDGTCNVVTTSKLLLLFSGLIIGPQFLAAHMNIAAMITSTGLDSHEASSESSANIHLKTE